MADLWKIDVEGAELFVLRGASQHFADGGRPLIVAEAYARGKSVAAMVPGTSSLRCLGWATDSSSCAGED